MTAHRIRVNHDGGPPDSWLLEFQAGHLCTECRHTEWIPCFPFIQRFSNTDSLWGIDSEDDIPQDWKALCVDWLTWCKAREARGQILNTGRGSEELLGKWVTT